ncbi:hypothetical protein F2Q69_00061010 [Brassica cretica]|uniref:Uncharacterized protein n=1 Tax=Brassica cretica TaxID=69181 RepID=A0A8S9RDA3_BRACR|nr:hypothetical protein F2Q69_00061010 [Brassica cretica]
MEGTASWDVIEWSKVDLLGQVLFQAWIACWNLRVSHSRWNEDIKLVELDIKLVEQSNVIDVPGLYYRNIPSLASTVIEEMSTKMEEVRNGMAKDVLFRFVVAGFSNLEVESNPCFTTTRKNMIYELLIPANVVKENGLTFCDRIKYIDGEGIMGLKANGLMIGFASRDGTGFAEETGLKRVILSTVRCFISGRKFTQSKSQSLVAESIIIISSSSPHPSSITHHHNYQNSYLCLSMAFVCFMSVAVFFSGFYLSSTFFIPKQP